MSIYVVAQIRIHDRAEYAKYEGGFMEIFSQHGGEMLAVDESPTVLEGQWSHTRTVIIKFDDKSAVDAWYHSESYQRLAEHRWAASVADIALIQGLPAVG